MSITEAVTVCFKKYADFTGRASRPEFWWFMLATTIGNIILQLLSLTLTVVFVLVTLLPSLAVGARRLHDIGRTGWWLLIGLIPLIGPLVLIVFAVQRGEAGDNRFGPPPSNGAVPSPAAATFH